MTRPAGWRRNLLAFACGVLATLTLPPFFLFPLIVPAYGGLYWLLCTPPASGGGISMRRAFADGWFWGWGFCISGLYWFCIALLTEPDKFAWLIPFALFGLTAVIAVYFGVIGLLFSRIRVGGISGIFIFSVAWLLVEYARGHLFTGFPWNLAGYGIGFSDASLQLASLIGAYGLTWLVVFLGALPAALPLKLPRARAAVLCAYLLFAAACGWGAWRLQHAQVEYVEGVTIRVVQANIAQHHKWNPESQMQGLQEHVRLTRLPGIEQVSHVIWPETAVPYLIQDGGTLAARLGEILPQHTVLITGALSAKEEGKAREITNSIVALDHRGAIVGAYDKYKLVPFGEFLPFRSLIPAAWLTPVGASDFASGPGPQTLKWPGLPPLRPLICYEAIFPAEAGAEGERPQLLLNLTNDAWFGLSSGPYQHFEMARMRAVEEGLPLVRVANTGISAVIDAYGRVESRMELGQQGIVDFKLQKSQLYDTTYEISKKIVLLFLISVTILLILWNRKPPSN